MCVSDREIEGKFGSCLDTQHVVSLFMLVYLGGTAKNICTVLEATVISNRYICVNTLFF